MFGSVKKILLSIQNNILDVIKYKSGPKKTKRQQAKLDAEREAGRLGAESTNCTPIM